MMTAKRPPSDKPAAPPVSGVRSAIDPAELFREALPSILKMARNRGFDDPGQRDIAQTVGVSLVEQRGDYDPERGTPIGWAIGIAKNVIRQAERKQRTERRYIDGAPSEATDDRPALDMTPEESARAHAALAMIGAALTDEERDIFELSAEQHTAEEIGGILGLTRSRVEQRIREARERIAALLKRIGEDKEGAAHVRGAVLLPFVTVEDLEEALRAGRVREGVAEQLWRRVLDRIGHDGGGGDEPPEAPPPKPPAQRAPSPVDAAPGPQLPALGQLARTGARVVLSTGQLATGAAVVFLTGAAVGIAIFAAMTTAGRDAPPSIHAEPTPGPAVTLAATSAPSTSASEAAGIAATTPAGTARAAPPASSDPNTMSESALLQTATAAAPAIALALADKHEQRFPREHVEKREMIRVRALLALGRRSEAEARGRALKGTVYEKMVEEALGGPSR